MKFHSKYDQDILCVCAYDDGPLVYGFCQDGQDYLAVKQSETSEANTWLFVPLTPKDKLKFDAYCEGQLSLSDLITSRSGFIVEFDEEGDQVMETKVDCLLPEMITLPA
jgi:hypothetical protein